PHLGSAGPGGAACLLDVVVDRSHEPLERVEPALLPDRRPDLDDEPLAVEVVVEVEQMGLDPTLDTVEVRVRANRDCRSMIAGPTGVDSVGRDEKVLRNVEVRRREPELATASVAAYDDPLDFGRPSEQRRRSPDLARADKLTDPAGRDVLVERHPAHVEAEA